MLELQLTIQNNQVNIRANGKQSHQFSLHDLSQSEQEWKDFYKNPRAYGEKLFNALFKDAARTEFDALSKQSERTIVLVLESSELDVMAWEYAYNEAKEEYVVEDCAFVRALPEKERPANGRMKNEVERVPLLFIPANPLVDVSGEPMRALDVEGEWREMKRLIEKSNAPFDMIELRPATPEALQSVMARFQNGMIAHFSGHGAATRDGAILLFERENGASNPLEAREFVREIKDKAWIGFLSACQSAVPERTEFSNLARELAKAGVPFALGMQFNLPDPFAPNISGQFYNYLAHGHAVPEAARQARRAVKRENEFFVGMIALYAAHPDEVGTLRQAQGGAWRGAGAQTVSLFRPADVSDLPSPASGLIGRQRELIRIGTRLLEGKKPLTVTMHGAGGIGKTALLWQALLRFAPSFELTLAIGLDPLPSLESVLGRIERFLGLPSPCANDTQEREAIVRNALTSKRTLLGLDNFETLNHALNEKGSENENTAKSLHEFFSSLCSEGVALSVTSRQATDLPSEELFEIKGLEEKSGGNVFREVSGNRRDTLTEMQTYKISEAVDGHPLALQLLGSVYKKRADLSPDEFLKKIQSLLSETKDQWTKSKRHISLEACFAFSMDNLAKTGEGLILHAALLRLGLFIGFFSPITASSVIANKWWKTDEEADDQRGDAERICHTLWEHSLLERLRIPLEEVDFYLYRMHPVLRPFTEQDLTEDWLAVNEIYYQSIVKLIDIAEGNIDRNSVAAQVVLHALPDLTHAAKLITNTIYKYKVGKILSHFGFYDDALQLFEEVRSSDESMDDQRGEAATIHAIADIHLRRGNLDEAMKLYTQSQEIYDEIGELQGKRVVLNGMATIYSYRGELDRAMELYEQSLKISDSDDVIGRGIVLHNMAGILADRREYEKAMELCNQAFEIFVDNDHEIGVAAILSTVAKMNEENGDLKTAIEYYRRSLKLKEKLGDPVSKADTLAAMGIALWKSSDYAEGLRATVDSLEIFLEAGAKSEADKAASIILYMCNDIGVEKFSELWLEEIRQPLPEFYTEQPEDEDDVTIE
ncbi:MAG: tetratricopeptide repeat protein [Chloroflexi bacterium]|nr:tetratricopeptide repeat protein [Chloroflexota bacterium]